MLGTEYEYASVEVLINQLSAMNQPLHRALECCMVQLSPVGFG